MGPICLPDPAQDYHNVKALVTGWGTLQQGGEHQDILQQGTVTTMTNQQCRRRYNITDNMICARGVGRDSCQGDSGGPLAVQADGRHYSVIGVVSWAEGCAKPGYPTVYTRLTSLLDWLTPILIKPSQGLDIFLIFSFSFSLSYAEILCSVFL